MTRGSPATVLLILAIVFSVYAPSLSNGFAMDDRMVAMGTLDSGLPNRTVHDLRPIGEYFDLHYWAGVQPGGRLFRPLTIYGFALRHDWVGDNPFVPHLINVLLHLCAVWIVFWMLRCFTDSTAAIAFGAAVFGLHAIHSEVVAAVVGRAELLAFVFGAGGLWCWQGSRASPIGRRVLGAVGANVAFFIAFHSKESAVAWLPFAFVFAVARHWHDESRVMRWSELARTALNVAIIGAIPLGVFLYLRAAALAGLQAEDVTHLVNQVAELAMFERWPTAIYVLGYALILTLLPFSLAADYSTYVFPTIESLFDVRCLAVLLLCGVIWFKVIRHRVQSPVLFLAAATFFGFSFITSNVPIAIGTIFGERLYYTASLATSFLVASGLQVAIRRPALERVLLFALGAWLAANCMVLHDRHRIWNDDESLFLHEVQNQPTSVRMHTTAAQVQSDRGAVNQALDHLYRARSLDPENALVWNNIAAMHLDAGRFELAEQCVRRGLAAVHVSGDEDRYKLHCNLGLILIRTNRASAAVQHFKQTLAHRALFMRAFAELQTLVIQRSLTPEALGGVLAELRKNHAEDAPYWHLYEGLHRIAGGDVEGGGAELELGLGSLPSFEDRAEWSDRIAVRLEVLGVPAAVVDWNQRALVLRPSRVSTFRNLIRLTTAKSWTMESLRKWLQERVGSKPGEPAWRLYQALAAYHDSILQNSPQLQSATRTTLESLLPELPRWRDHGRLHSEARLQLARLCDALGDVDAASAHREIIANDPAFPRSVRRDARALVRR